jgi:hypothetical protein
MKFKTLNKLKYFNFGSGILVVLKFVILMKAHGNL